MKDKKHISCIALILAAGLVCTAQPQPPMRTVKQGRVVWNYEYYAPGPPIKISSATEILPKDFSQHDIVKLFENLKEKTKGFAKTRVTDAEMLTLLKNKKILGDLTTDDLFAFNIQPSQDLHGKNRNDDEIYWGDLYGLNPNSYIEPQNDSVGGCGVGSGTVPRPVDLRDELLSKITPDPSSSDEFWQNSYLPIVGFMPIYDMKSYKGKVISGDCSYTYFVPSPQVFYQLTFNNKQPYQLFKTDARLFDLDAYDYRDTERPGIVAWTSDVKGIAAYQVKVKFVVKLVPPFIRTKSIKKYDPVEKASFDAIINQIVVDIVGSWAIDGETGRILSRELGQKTTE